MTNWIFFIAFILVTAWVGTMASKKVVSSDDFISAGGTLGPLAISCTLIATWLGTGSLIGFVGTGYAYGSTVVAFTAGSAVAAFLILIIFSMKCIYRTGNLNTSVSYFNCIICFKSSSCSLCCFLL